MTIALEPVARGLHFPTGLAFDPQGALWVTESGLPFGGAPPGGRLICCEGGRRVVAQGLRAPVNGLLWHDGDWIISEGGRPGRLSRISPGGTQTTLLDGLPGFGNYQTNMAVRGADGRLYFSQGAMTNMGVIGLDSVELGWLREARHDADLPGHDIVVGDDTFETPDPAGGTASTGVFAPYGTPGTPRRIPAALPCTAAVLSCEPDGSDLRLVAWGLRNAYGLLVLPDGRLLATDQGADDRGSRPIGNVPELLYEVRPGLWYGWPDFVGGVSVTDPRFVPVRGPAPRPILHNHAELPPLAHPLVTLPVNSAATKLARIPDDAPRHAGQLLVCLFGDERPLTGPPGPKVGRALVRVDLDTGRYHPVDHAPLHRPIDVQIHDGFVYILDFGDFEMSPRQVSAVPASGTVSRFPLTAL